MEELAPGIFVETRFRRVNVGAVQTDEGWILIDTPPFPGDAQRWREMLRLIDEKPVLAIVNTDGHRDRILGNHWFNARVIVSHDDTFEQMDNLPSAFMEASIDSLTSDNLVRSTFTGLQLHLPSIGFTRRMQLRFGGRNVPLLAMEGPSTGSVWVHFPEHRLLFTGDSVVVDQHVYINCSCTKQWLESLTVLRRLRFPADVIVPGRGPLVDKGATEAVSNYLRLARRRVHSLYRAGRPRADTSTLVPELLEMFPYEEHDLERIQRRIKLGLDRIYEEFKLSERSNDLPVTNNHTNGQ